MPISRIFGLMIASWGALFWGGMVAVDSFAATVPAEDIAAERMVQKSQQAYRSCLIRNYRVNAMGAASSLNDITTSCRPVAAKLSTGLIRAGFTVRQADQQIGASSSAIHQKMLRLMPPCPTDQPMRHMS